MEKINTEILVSSLFTIGFDKVDSLLYTYTLGQLSIDNNLNLDIKEDSNGTVFFLDLITNGTGIIRDLYDNGCSYIIMREYGIDNFRELVNEISMLEDNA